MSAMSGSRHLRASATGVSPSPVRLAYNPGLDAFRGLSVIAVVLYHTGVTTGGWIGVECFFVLSGYLITSLLINEYDHTRRIDLIGFWRRRARRLLPALFLLLGSIAVYVRVVAEPSEYGPIRRDVVGALTYTSNWLAIHGGSGYWQHFAAPSPLRHMWSLAVEEQFYLVYPLLAVVLLRSRRARSVAVPAMAIVALAWQLWMTQHATLDRLYLGTDTRAFGILVGATVAVIPRGAGRRVARWIAPIALLGLAAAAATLDGNSGATFRGPFQLTTLAAGLTVFGLRAGSGDPLVSVLARRWLVAVGRWSYGIYLVHWPMVALAARHPGLRSLEVAAVVLPVSIVIAAASYRWIESPIRHGGLARLGRPWIVGTGLAALGAAAVLSSTVGATAPLAASTVARAPIPSLPTLCATAPCRGLMWWA